MSRDVRRVPLDFEWPLNKVWSGYLMPTELRLPPCPDCGDEDGRPDGMTREARAIALTFYPHQISWTDREHAERLAWCDKLGQAEVDHLLSEGRLHTLVEREPTEDNPRTWEWVAKPLTAAEVNARQRRGGFSGHDGINRHILIRFRCERLGIPLACPTCAGEAVVGTREQRAAYEAWTPAAPPAGDGWQLWETVSEGSPVSPVFGSRDGLVVWLTTDYRQVGSDRPLTREQAEAFVSAGSSVGSGVILADGRQLSGEAAVADLGSAR